MASIRKYQGKRGLRYQATVRRAGHPAVTKSFSTKKLAESWARTQEQAIEEGSALLNAAARRKTLGDLIDLHLKRASGKDPSKAERLEWWRAKLGKRKLVDITKGVISEALDDLGSKPSARTGKPLAPSTVNRYLTELSAALREAVNREWLRDNPARRVSRRHEDNARHRYLRDEERPALLAACQDDEAPRWLHPLVLLALSTGARRGELLGLRWQDVDLERGRAHVANTKSGRPRMLVLLKPVVAALTEWGRVRKLNDDRVIPIGRYDLDKPWRAACQRAGLKEHLRWHDLRHSAASYLAQNGATLAVIMQTLGHTSLAATQRYQHLLVDHVEDALSKAMEGKL